MKRTILLSILLILIFTSCKQEIAIVTSEEADTVVTFAAGELSKYLSEIYPKYRFPVTSDAEGDQTIYLRVTGDTPGVPDNAEGYLVKSEGDRAWILSKGNTGLIYGVYGMLEKLGCGFYLSDEMLAEPKDNFDFREWDLTNEPLIEERFVFNWHNFISGCTGWDKKHWFEWIDRSQKMGYNTIMIHTYHNNPMHTYTFNGIEKEVGYIATSAKGRDWGNIPVNDVRRLPGGDIFHAAEFGSEMAIVPDARRVETAQEAMAEVFDYAQKRGVEVNFAFDIDMPVHFLQNSMIETIPKEEMFYLQNPEIWLPRPDKPGGYEFYKSQIEGLLNTYPMITGITFFRRGSSFFRDAKPGELPLEWQQEYRSTLNQHPYLQEIGEPEVTGSFITAKLVSAYQQILDELGRSDIDLGTGSWLSGFVVPTAAFLPKDIKLMPIDWNSRFDQSMMDNEAILGNFASPECANRVVPFIWAHHDDGKYLGRPFKPTVDLYSKLKQGKCTSFGVFHWMNRPLDLFFKNMGRQVWRKTENEPLDKTCRLMATHYFGSEKLAVYFEEWMDHAPMFGRATIMNFFYRNMDDGVFDFDKAIMECKKRIEILDEADVSRMNDKQKAYVRYFRTLEQFIIDFSETQPHLLNAEKFLNEGNVEKAREELLKGDPAKCVKTYSKLSQVAKKERGEMAFTYRLATKYIPDYMSFEQRTRLKPYYVNIDTVVYEDLAQGNVHVTYHIDQEGNFWECLGQKEFDSRVVELPNVSELDDELSPFAEIFQYGLKISSREAIPVKPVMRAMAVKNKNKVCKGKYELRLLVASHNGEQVAFDVEVNGEKSTMKVRGRSVVRTTVEQEETGVLSLVIEPIEGEVMVCGVIMEPV